jgi:hypothetical protein
MAPRALFYYLCLLDSRPCEAQEHPLAAWECEPTSPSHGSVADSPGKGSF